MLIADAWKKYVKTNEYWPCTNPTTTSCFWIQNLIKETCCYASRIVLNFLDIRVIFFSVYCRIKVLKCRLLGFEVSSRRTKWPVMLNRFMIRSSLIVKRFSIHFFREHTSGKCTVLWLKLFKCLGKFVVLLRRPAVVLFSEPIAFCRQIKAFQNRKIIQAFFFDFRKHNSRNWAELWS
jgi:hypothetical protein